MKLSISHFLAVMAIKASLVEAFITTGVKNFQSRTASSSPMVRQSSSKVSSSTTSLQMSDFDFPSAMPAKPQQTMKEKLEDSATSFIADLTARLGDGVDPPPEMAALKEARDADSDENTLAMRIYELMIGE